jgi:hypothetical protein
MKSDTQLAIPKYFHARCGFMGLLNPHIYFFSVKINGTCKGTVRTPAYLWHIKKLYEQDLTIVIPKTLKSTYIAVDKYEITNISYKNNLQYRAVFDVRYVIQLSSNHARSNRAAQFFFAEVVFTLFFLLFRLMHTPPAPAKQLAGIMTECTAY